MIKTIHNVNKVILICRGEGEKGFVFNDSNYFNIGYMLYLIKDNPMHVIFEPIFTAPLTHFYIDDARTRVTV